MIALLDRQKCFKSAEKKNVEKLEKDEKSNRLSIRPPLLVLIYSRYPFLNGKSKNKIKEEKKRKMELRILA